MAKNIDWIAIKNEYINTGISQRKLSEKYGVSYNTLKDKANKEKWAEDKKSQHIKITSKTHQKTAEKIADKESDILVRIGSAAENLLDKIEEATEQLNNHLVKNKKKTKTIEYNNNHRPDKPTREVIEELEETEFIFGDIDRVGLKLVVGALKDLRDIVKEGNPQDESKKINDDIQNLADLINNPMPNRNIEDFEVEEDE